MTDVLLTIITAIAAFAATNIDDLFILMIYFSKGDKLRNIVLGQYIGFIIIILLSVLGFVGSLILNSPWLGLLGVLPIFIGISKLMQKEEEIKISNHVHEPSFFKRFFNIEIWSVAAVTLANSSDNFSVYIPLFVNKSWAYVMLTMFIFLVLVGVWCYIAYRIVKHKKIENLLKVYGQRVMPWILIFLGVFILIENDVLKLLIDLI